MTAIFFATAYPPQIQRQLHLTNDRAVRNPIALAMRENVAVPSRPDLPRCTGPTRVDVPHRVENGEVLNVGSPAGSECPPVAHLRPRWLDAGIVLWTLLAGSAC